MTIEDVDLYLIAHKVRGERAFDIAVAMPMGDDEVWWIIPTSGHRAYPYWYDKLECLGDITDYGFNPAVVGDPPLDLRDHYAIAEAPAQRASAEPRTRTRTPTLDDI